MLFRAILIVIAVFLVARYLKAILFPKQRSSPIKGKPRDADRPVDRGRIQDATFKDIPKDET